MKVLTNGDIRNIRDVLIRAGFDCVVNNDGDNAVRLEINWDGHFGNAWRSGIEAACFFIRNSAKDVEIRFIRGDDENIDADGNLVDDYKCWAVLRVWGC